MLLWQILIDGFAISALYALGATGFTLIFGPYTRFGSLRSFALTARRSVSPVSQSRVFLKTRIEPVM